MIIFCLLLNSCCYHLQNDKILCTSSWLILFLMCWYQAHPLKFSDVTFLPSLHYLVSFILYCNFCYELFRFYHIISHSSQYYTGPFHIFSVHTTKLLWCYPVLVCNIYCCVIQYQICVVSDLQKYALCFQVYTYIADVSNVYSMVWFVYAEFPMFLHLVFTLWFRRKA